jgi:ATP phosphoribosyltransferase regulatory subunit
LQQAIAELRSRGEVVIVDLPGHEGTHAELECDRRLERRGAKWIVAPLN